MLDLIDLNSTFQASEIEILQILLEKEFWLLVGHPEAIFNEILFSRSMQKEKQREKNRQAVQRFRTKRKFS